MHCGQGIETKRLSVLRFWIEILSFRRRCPVDVASRPRLDGFRNTNFAAAMATWRAYAPRAAVALELLYPPSRAGASW